MKKHYFLNSFFLPLFLFANLNLAPIASTLVPDSANVQNSSVPHIDNPKLSSIDEIAKSPNNTTNLKKATKPTCSDFYGYISISGKNICLSSTGDTSQNLSYSNSYIYNNDKYNSHDQFIFGHNSANLFGNLKNLSVGETFSVTIKGVKTSYKISLKEVVCDYSNPEYPCSNYQDPILDMRNVLHPSLKGANLSIMTCAGTGIGNGDATHRLTIYAVKI